MLASVCLSHPPAALGAGGWCCKGPTLTAAPARPSEPGGPAWALSVGGSDESSEAFSGGGEFVFELFGAALGGVGLSCAGVAFGEELAVRGF